MELAQCQGPKTVRNCESVTSRQQQDWLLGNCHLICMFIAVTFRRNISIHHHQQQYRWGKTWKEMWLFPEQWSGSLVTISPESFSWRRWVGCPRRSRPPSGLRMLESWHVSAWGEETETAWCQALEWGVWGQAGQEARVGPHTLSASTPPPVLQPEIMEGFRKGSTTLQHHVALF